MGVRPVSVRSSGAAFANIAGGVGLRRAFGMHLGEVGAAGEVVAMSS